MKKKKTNYDIWKEKLLSKPGMQEYYDSLTTEQKEIFNKEREGITR